MTWRFPWRSIASLAAWLVLSPALAQAPAAVPAPPAGAAPEASSLVVMNREIFTFRASYLGFTPADRASASRDRIEGLLSKGGPGVVATQKTDSAAAVTIDGALAFAVGPGDVDPIAGETQQAAALAAADRLRRAIEENREARDFEALSRAALMAAIGTVVFFAIAWLLHRARRAMTGRLVGMAHATAGRVNVAGIELLDRSRLLPIVGRALSLAYWLVVLALANEWLGRTLELFPYTRPWGERINQFLFTTAAQLLRSIAGAIPPLLVAVAIFFIARFVASILKRFFDRIADGRLQMGWLDADTARPTRRLASAIVWLLALVMAYPYLPGASTEAFKGLSVLVGLMVSLGGASVMGQALSGAILMYTRTFRVGEFVRVGDHEGTVVEMGMYQTRIRTGMGDEIFLPNALVLGSVTRNFSRTQAGGYVMQAEATIGYDTPWRQVHAMLIEAALRTDGVIKDPTPRVMQLALSDFYVEYRLICVSDPVKPYQRAEAQSRLLQNIQDVFNENGVQIMSPHYFADPAQPKVVAPSHWNEPLKPPGAKPSA